ISIQTQERESPRARRRERLNNRKSGLEERRGPSAAGRHGVGTCALPQGPKRPAMAVFRAGLLQPLPVIAHEIPEPMRVRVPRVLNECCKRRRAYFRQQLHVSRLCKRAREQQGTSVVIDTIAMS